MADILNIKNKEYKKLEQLQERIRELEVFLGLKRDEHGDSLNKASLGNSFAAIRLQQIRDQHPAEWEEYQSLVLAELELDQELGLTDNIMNSLFPDEKDIDPDNISTLTELHCHVVE